MYSMTYILAYASGAHPYDRMREDVDFFYWLSVRINRPQLYTLYTKPIIYLRQLPGQDLFRRG